MVMGKWLVFRVLKVINVLMCSWVLRGCRGGEHINFSVQKVPVLENFILDGLKFVNFFVNLTYPEPTPNTIKKKAVR